MPLNEADRMMIMSMLRRLRWGWILLDGFILSCLVALFFVTRRPIHLTWARPRPPATLVYSKEEVTKQPDDYTGQPGNLLLNRHWLAWAGGRLSTVSAVSG